MAPLQNQLAKQLKRWCFTLNNYTEEDVAAIREYAKQSCRYLVFGREKGESGTPHLQGFLVGKNAIRGTALHNKFRRMHLEGANGTSVEASTYCKKDGDFEEFGTVPDEGGKTVQRASYAECLTLATAGRIREIAESYPEMWLRYRTALLSAPRDFARKPHDLCYLPGIWIHGPAGTGKSRVCREIGLPSLYEKRANKWFDGYHNEVGMLIEDLDPSHRFLAYDLKIWADRYSFPAEIKGGAIQCRPRHVLITSQYHPHDIWDDVPTREAINRRFEICVISTPRDYKSCLTYLRTLISSRDAEQARCIEGKSRPLVLSAP